jgi:hypothetical protein
LQPLLMYSSSTSSSVMRKSPSLLKAVFVPAVKFYGQLHFQPAVFFNRLVVVYYIVQLCTSTCTENNLLTRRKHRKRKKNNYMFICDGNINVSAKSCISLLKHGSINFYANKIGPDPEAEHPLNVMKHG